MGLRIVAIYGNYYYIVSAVSTFINLIYGAITASIGNSIATESLEKNYADLKKFFFLNTWLIGWCSICFICLFQDFMSIWMGDRLLFGMGTVFCLVLRFYFEQIRKVILTYKDAAGMWWADKWRPIVGCLVNLILNIVMVKAIGVVGVMLSTVISYAFVEIPWETHVLFKCYFDKSELSYYRQLLIATIGLVVSGVVTYKICTYICFNHIVSLFIKGVVCTIIPNLIFLLLNLKNPECANGMRFVRKIIKSSH